MLGFLLPPVGKCLFDPDLYRVLGNTDPLFRLNLARVYARYAHPDDEWRAWNLVRSLIHPPLAVAEDSDIWWQARALDGKLRVRRAERAIRSIWGGTSRYTPEVPEGALDSTPFLREDR